MNEINSDEKVFSTLSESYSLERCQSTSPILKFQKLSEDSILPQRNNKECCIGDSGYDVFAINNIVIPARTNIRVDIGLRVAYINAGYWIRVESRSGLFFKNGVSVFNGIIDCSYRGELGISLINNSDKDYSVTKGDRIAQLIMYKLIEPEISWSDSIDDTNRGSNGFGSSGI